MTKVVYNARHGGFSISMKCAQWMAERGHEPAKEILKRYEVDGTCQWWYGDIRCDRHDPLLVEAVEELGPKAGGMYNEQRVPLLDQWDVESAETSRPQLRIHYLKGDIYLIREYDGMERVMEPEDMNWVTCK